VQDPRPPHEICHHRPVSSWVTKPGARLSRAGVATRPTTTSLCVSSERPRPALPERNSYWDSLNDRAARIVRMALGTGCTVHMPEGVPTRPRMAASAVHPRARQGGRRRKEWCN
jgi:hypothetical protein